MWKLRQERRGTTESYAVGPGSAPGETERVPGSCLRPVFLLRVRADDWNFLLKDGKSELSSDPAKKTTSLEWTKFWFFGRDQMEKSECPDQTVLKPQLSF